MYIDIVPARQWSMRFEGEEVKVVALGTGWVAAITSLNFLRIFTEGGLQVGSVKINYTFFCYHRRCKVTNIHNTKLHLVVETCSVP